LTLKVVLHVCCAPDATIPWPALMEEGHKVTGYFYSSNIHPFEEFRRRSEDVERLALHLGAEFLVDEYRPLNWLEKVSSHILSPEGGERCALCFREQLEGAARMAVERGFDALCTTLTISPHKDVGLVDVIGREVCDERGLEWLSRIWRKNGGFPASVRKSRQLGLYRQNYCGCVMSIRDEGTE